MTLMLMSSFSPFDDHPNNGSRQHPNIGSSNSNSGSNVMNRQHQEQLQQQQQQRLPQEQGYHNNKSSSTSFSALVSQNLDDTYRTTATDKDGSSYHKETTYATTGVTRKISSATRSTTTAASAASSGLGYGYHCAKPKSLFPWKLRQLINDAMVEGNDHIVSWIPDGTGFKVYEPDLFASNILKRYFRQSHFRSFTRQLYHYGFERVHTGPHRGAFCHEMFQRDNESLCLSMGHKHRGSTSAAAIKDNGRQLLGSSNLPHLSSRSTHGHLPLPPPPPQMMTSAPTPNHVFSTRGKYNINPISTSMMQPDHVAVPSFHNSVSLSTQIYPIVHSSPKLARDGNGTGNETESVQQMMMNSFTQPQQQMFLQKQRPNQYYQSQSTQYQQNPLDLFNNNIPDSELTSDCLEALLISLRDTPNESQTTTHVPQEEANRSDILEPRPIEEMVQIQHQKK